MRRFRGVIQSNIEPRDKEIIWKCGDRLLYWDGAWKDLISYNASDIKYTPDGAEATNVEHALNILWKYTGAPAPSPEEGTSINVNAVLTKKRVTPADKIKLKFGFTIGEYLDIGTPKYAEVSLRVSKVGLTVPIYERDLGEFVSAKSTTELNHEIDLSPIITSNNIEKGVLEIALTVIYTTFYINEHGEEVPNILQREKVNSLTIGELDYTTIEIDEAILDESSHTHDSKGNITNLDNSTGARTSTTYLPSGHISTILKQCHRYLGKVIKKGNTVNLEGNPNNITAEGKSFPGVDNTGEMLLIQLDDYNSKYYAVDALEGVNRRKTTLDGIKGHGEVGVKIPGFWYKGINFNSPQNPTLSRKYICFSSNQELPSESTATKIIYITDLLSNKATRTSEFGLYKENKALQCTHEPDSVDSRILEDITPNYNVYRINVEGFKKLRYPAAVGSSICSVFTDDENKIITDSEENVVNVGELSINNTAFVYNGMSVITTIPNGAKYFYITLNKFISDTSEVTSEPCDIVLHRGWDFESGDEMNEDNAKDWITDMEPNWVYSDPVFIHATECTVDDSGNLYTPFDGAKTPVKGEGDENIGLLTDGDWTQYSMRNAAYKRGLQLIDYEASKLIAILFMAKYGRRNSQYQLGSGLSSRSRKLGVTSPYGIRDTVIPQELNISGNYSSAAIAITTEGGSTIYEYPGSPNFIGIEDVHGNVGEWLDRAYYSNITPEDCGKLVITMPDLSIRKIYGVTPTNNIPRVAVHGKYCDILSCSKNTGSEVTGYTDYQKTNTILQDTWANTSAVSRSSYSYYPSGGVFCLDGYYAVGYADSYTGSRLIFRGNMVETRDIDLFENSEELR